MKSYVVTEKQLNFIELALHLAEYWVDDYSGDDKQKLHDQVDVLQAKVAILEIKGTLNEK